MVEEMEKMVAKIDKSKLYDIKEAFKMQKKYELLALEDYNHPNGIFSIRQGETSIVTGLLAELILKSSKGKVILAENYNKLVSEKDTLKDSVRDVVEEMVNKRLSEKAVKTTNMITEGSEITATEEEISSKPKNKK